MKIKKTLSVIILIIIISINLQVNSIVNFRTKDAIILYIGSPVAFVDNEIMLIEPTNAAVVPQKIQGKTMVPLSFIVESLGSEVLSDPSKDIIIKHNKKIIELEINENVMYLDGEKINLDVAPIISDGITLVPLRAISEAFDKKVFYNRKLIIISDVDNIFNIVDDKHFIDGLIGRFTGEIPIPQDSYKTLSAKSIEKLEKSVVMLNIFDNKRKIGQGSAFCIGDGLFLTNYHVVENSEKIELVSFDGEIYQVEGIVKFDPVKDLAIIKTTDNTPITPMKLGYDTNYRKGDRIITIGSPLSYQNTISDGIISGIRNFDSVDNIQITAPITFGSSGGPLINMNGDVIGVCTSVIREGNLNFAVSINYIEDWILELSKISFEEIKILTGDELKFLDPSIPDEEINEVILKFFNAVTEKNIQDFFDTYSFEFYYDYYGIDFDDIDFDLDEDDDEYYFYNLELDIFEKSSVRAGVNVSSFLRTYYPYFKDNDYSKFEGEMWLKKFDGVWKIYLIEIDEDYLFSIENLSETHFTEGDTIEIFFMSYEDIISELEYWEKGKPETKKLKIVNNEPSDYHNIELTGLSKDIEYEYSLICKFDDLVFETRVETFIITD